MSIIYDSYFGFDALCSEIIDIGSGIEMVAVLNHKGRAIETRSRDETKNRYLPAEKYEMFFMQSVLQTSMNKDHDDELGRVTSSILEREKFTVFSFEFLNYVTVVIARPGRNLIQLRDGILDKINNMKKTRMP